MAPLFNGKPPTRATDMIVTSPQLLPRRGFRAIVVNFCRGRSFAKTDRSANLPS
jgi:hypothetical protein